MLYYDSDYDRHVGVDTLHKEFEEAKAVGSTTAETFKEYTSNCMSYNGGTLEETDKEYCKCGSIKKIGFLCMDCGRL